MPVSPKPLFSVPPFRPAHWVSPRVRMRDGDITGAQRALADLGHYRPRPGLGFAPVAERRLFEGLKTFQAAQGLAPDGVMGPDGPTAQMLDAARHAKATAGAARPARAALGRGANLPLDATVGEGGRNLEADVRAAKRALALVGYYPREKARDPDGRTGKADGHDFEFGLGAFQRRFGLPADRRMAPFGPTQEKLDRLLQPGLDRAFGFDLEQPRRTADGSESLLLIAPDAGGGPSAEAEILGGLRGHILGHVADVRREDALYGFGGGDALVGGEGEDALNDSAAGEATEADAPAETEGESGEDDGPARSVAPERSDERVPADEQGDDTADEALYRAVDGIASDLSGRQVAEVLRLAEERDVDALDSAALRELADWVRENRPDFAEDLRAKLASGELDAEELSRRTVLQARRLKSGAGQSYVLKARLADHVAVLRDLYQEQGLSADEAANKVAARLTEATRGATGETVADVALAILEFAPGAGEALSLVEAAKLKAQIDEARARGDFETAGSLETSLALALAGAIPFVGKVAKLGKWGRKLYQFIDGQGARRKLLKWEKDFTKEFRAHTLESVFDPEAWAMLDVETRKSLESIFSHAKGRQSEVLLRETLDRAGLKRALKEESRKRRYRTRFKDGRPDRFRHFDEVAYGELKKAFLGMVILPVRKDDAWAYEIKSANSRLSTNQKIIDEAVSSGEAKLEPALAKSSKETLPAVQTEIRHLRVPLGVIPEDRLVEDVLSALRDKKASTNLCRNVENAIHQAYDIEQTFRKNGHGELAEQITIAAVLSAAGAVTAVGANEDF